MASPRGAVERACLAVGWAGAAAAIVTTVTLGIAQRSAPGAPTQVSLHTAPAAVVHVTAYTPTPICAPRPSATERRRLERLMRAPMRDPFAFAG
jgi:hypothetical protein